MSQTPTLAELILALQKFGLTVSLNVNGNISEQSPSAQLTAPPQSDPVPVTVPDAVLVTDSDLESDLSDDDSPVLVASVTPHTPTIAGDPPSPVALDTAPTPAVATGVHPSAPSGSDSPPIASSSTQSTQGGNRWYCVTVGREVGVFRGWNVAGPLVTGYPNCCAVKFKTYEEAAAAFENSRTQT